MTDIAAKYPLFDNVVTLTFGYYIRNGVPKETIEPCEKIIRRTAEVIDTCIDRPQREKECLMIAALAVKMDMKLAPDVAPLIENDVMNTIRNVCLASGPNPDVCQVLIAERISGLETKDTWDKQYLSELRLSIEESMEIGKAPRLNALFDETCERLVEKPARKPAFITAANRKR